MKLQGFVGTGSGKMGASVFAVRNCMQIVRQYQGVVSNPKSIAQIQQRAKLKLTSQVAAALSPVIFGFRGLEQGVSQRNAFVADIFKRGVVSYDTNSNKATMNVNNILLTNSNLAGGGVSGVAVTGTKVTANVFPVPEFSVPGAVVNAVVVRPIANGGVEYIGSASAPAQGATAIEVDTVSAPKAGDRLIVFLARPIQNETYVSYMNAVGEAATGSITLEAVIRSYARSLVFSRSSNLEITVS